ncbi:hypothetical protein D3C78_1857210 [compost metagenome]
MYIAFGDYFSIILDSDTGYIYATAADVPFEKRILISTSFTLFIQGLGTAYLYRKEERESDFLKIANLVFGPDSLVFWRETV